MGNSNSGRRGLPYAKRREIMRLIVDGRMADAQIARECGVHTTTITSIRRRRLKGIDLDSNDVRCPGCGALITITTTSAAKQCIKCYQEKTVMPRLRAQRVAKIARRQARRRAKADVSNLDPHRRNALQGILGARF